MAGRAGPSSSAADATSAAPRRRASPPPSARRAAGTGARHRTITAATADGRGTGRTAALMAEAGAEGVDAMGGDDERGR